MLVVVLADGKSKPNHLDNHRLLTPIDGKPLLQRTIDQFSPHGPVAVLSGDPTIRKAVNPTRFLPGSDKSHLFYGADMIRKGLEHYAARRHLILFGDVVFTPEAVATIVSHDPADWAVYGRSKTTGTHTAPYGEYFAIEINTNRVVDQGFKALRTIAATYRAGRWKRCTAWEWYFEMEGLPYRIKDSKNIAVGPHWVEINDTTDDIDLPSDLERVT